MAAALLQIQKASARVDRERAVVNFTHVISRSYHVRAGRSSRSSARAHARERLLRNAQGALSPWAGALGWRGRQGQPLHAADDTEQLLLLVTQSNSALNGWSLTPLTTRSDTKE